MLRPVVLALVLSGLCGAAQAARYDIVPPPEGICPEQDGITAAAGKLMPGDELVIGDGVYCQTGRRLIRASGTADRPIVIRAAEGAAPVLTRPDDPAGPQRHEGTEVDGAHLVLRGLRFHRGNRGLVFHAGAHHVTVEDCEVAYTANNAMTLNNGDTADFVIRRNRIHHTGNLDPAHGNTEGEGLYIGCNNAKCIASGHRIEDNLIHDLNATSGGGNDGIEIKYGSYGNLVRGNVIRGIHPVRDGIRFPCIFAYGARDADIDRPNIIEGNRMSGCGEAIQVVADAIVRDNLVLNSETALATYHHLQVPLQRNLVIERNTFHGSPVALEFGFNARPETMPRSPPNGIVFAGNAIYGWGFSPLLRVNLPAGGGIEIARNAVGGLDQPGRVRIEALGGLALGEDAFIAGGTAETDFVGAHAGDFRPQVGSVLQREDIGCCHGP